MLIHRFLPNLANPHCRNLFNLASTKRKVVKTIQLRTPLEQTVSVVADVANYSKFLPFCTTSVVAGAGNPTFSADLTFEWGSFKETIRHNVVVDATSVVSVAEASRIAKMVKYNWRFYPTTDNGTEVKVDLDVEFQNILHAAVFDLNVDQISTEMINRFRDRINTAHLLEKKN